MKKTIFWMIGCFVVFLFFVVGAHLFLSRSTVIQELPKNLQTNVAAPNEAPENAAVSERYSAQIDRVKVIFEHTDFTSYRLQTNNLIRTGELNTERGYGDDVDATVFVLNWRLSAGEQMRYVRLTAEPTNLYGLDTDGNIVRGNRLVREDE